MSSTPEYSKDYHVLGSIIMPEIPVLTQALPLEVGKLALLLEEGERKAINRIISARAALELGLNGDEPWHFGLMLEGISSIDLAKRDICSTEDTTKNRQIVRDKLGAVDDSHSVRRAIERGLVKRAPYRGLNLPHLNREELIELELSSFGVIPPKPKDAPGVKQQRIRSSKAILAKLGAPHMPRATFLSFSAGMLSPGVRRYTDVRGNSLREA